MSNTRRPGEYAVLDHLAHDPSPTKADHLAAIRRAVLAAAEANGGIVTAATIRPHLPEWVDSHRIGAVISALIQSGALVRAPGTTESGNAKSRNRHRPMARYMLNELTVAS